MHDLHSYAMKTRHSLFRAAGHIIKATNNAANAAEKGSSTKMRKAKFLLTLAAAAAVMSTAAMSFAQWDTLTATAKGTVTMAKPVSITTSDVTYTAQERTLGETPKYSSNVTFAIEANDVLTGKQPQLTLTATVNNGNTPVTDDFNVEITQNTTPVTQGTAVNASIGDNAYTVTLTPKSNTAPAYADGTTELTVEVTAELSATNKTV